MGKFVTAINCIDGRVQVPVSEFLKNRYKADYVDMITCPGPVKVLAQNESPSLISYLHDSAMLSVSHHNSETIAIVAHFDCAANSLTKTEQILQIKYSICHMSKWNCSASIIGLWVDDHWQVEEITCYTNTNSKKQTI
jgi:hypothetical protein